jgi:hypothetical protein
VASQAPPGDESQPQSTSIQPQKKSLQELSEKLGLTSDQTMALRQVLEKFRAKRQSLVNEAALGADAEQTGEKQRRLQREFFEELSKLLSPDQINEYKKIAQERSAAPGQAGAASGITTGGAEKISFPWLLAYKRVLEKLEMSPLQKQAIDEAFQGLNNQAVEMRYWDPGYEPANDPSLSRLMQTKLVWILTQTQYDQYLDFLRAEAEKVTGNEEGGAVEEKKEAPDTLQKAE